MTGRTTREDGSSHTSSSCAAGKAPAVPQKRISKASGGRKQKRQKESLTYHKSKSESEPEPPLLRPAAEPKRIGLHGQWYRRTDEIAGQKRGKKKSSHIWGKGKGFAIIHEAIGAKYYYCYQCLDEKKDIMYKPFSKRIRSLYCLFTD